MKLSGSSSVGIVAALLLVALAPLVACGDLKSAQPGTGEGSSGSSGAGGSSGTSGAPSSSSTNELTGAGPLGALPSGFCCTDDSQCRMRHCVATASGDKMCEDHCYADSACSRPPGFAFTCSSADHFEEGWCEPQGPAVRCIDPSTFERGSRKAGECCTATGDGNAGSECEGNWCISVSPGGGPENPFVCSQWCDLPKDCPSGTVCGPLHTCDPGNETYTCK